MELKSKSLIIILEKKRVNITDIEDLSTLKVPVGVLKKKTV